MIWIVIIGILNFFINLYIVFTNNEYSELIGWKIKTKHGYETNKDYFGKPYWAVPLPCILTPLVFNFFISTNKVEAGKDKKRRELAKEFQNNNPPKR